MLISFVSAKGSPGVTTTVLALGAQWPRTVVVVDCDPFGGDIPAGVGRGSWPRDAGLMELVVDSRTMPVETALRRRAFRAAGHCPLALGGFGGLGQASGVPWAPVAGAFARLPDADVLADCGRYAPAEGTGPLLRASDVVVLVTGSTLPAARSGARLAPMLRETLSMEPDDPRLAVLVVRPGQPYSAAEVADGCGLPLIGEVPHDPRAASVWSDGAPAGRWLARSRLQREARRVAHLLGGTPHPAASTNGAR